MKKRERAKRKDNVIFLPGLEKRLTEKGLEYLEMKRFNEAITFLEEAREHEPDNSDVLIGLVLAYFEAAEYKKGKELASEMLLRGIGDYFQMVDLYLTILIQLHEYQEIVTTIEALIDEKEIPPERYDHFLTILQFSRRMADNTQPDPSDEELEESNLRGLNLFQLNNLNEQMLVVSSLAEKNIRPYIEEIKEYLQADEGHPFLKSMLLSLLKEQEYDREIIVKKFNNIVTVTPTELSEINAQPRMKDIERILADRLESSNPVLFDNIRAMMERIFFISYPIKLDPEANSAWAAAFHMLGHSYQGIEIDLQEVSSDYEVSSQVIEKTMLIIGGIEEISYPNI
ncbi:tetratricopeptide repeat protein [Neobacillus sp. FSL H8-0543]|uniref:tetratricopeptide repeat protein n=1 Tax=Neobacillus sp. FSL H8-0543 TaxID=2954672 RepID=UPI00315844B4